MVDKDSFPSKKRVHNEIGSEFWEIPIKDEETDLFPEHANWFLSGRIALEAIVKGLKDCHSAALPSWCCDSMIKPFIDTGIKVLFYSISLKRDADGKYKMFKNIRYDTDVLLVMDYFGYSADETDLSQYTGIIIRDITHSLFTKQYVDADYYFGSLRKWCGILTGGYAWSNNKESICDANGIFGSASRKYISLRQQGMELKKRYIYGISDINGNRVTDKRFLDYFEKAECCLDSIRNDNDQENHGGLNKYEAQETVRTIIDNDASLAMRIDVDFVKERRRKNAQILMKAFQDWLVFPKMSDEECPMFVPIIVPNGKRESLRRVLIENEVYCPIHWPVSMFHVLDENEKDIYDNELSLVCDQRYSDTDMYRIVEVIREYCKKGML